MIRSPVQVRGPIAGAGRTCALGMAVLALTLPLGGCKVTTGQHREAGSSKVTRVLEGRYGRFDLTKPPSRDEAGMAAGATDVTYERRDFAPFRVQVLLPEGKQLDVSTRLLTFDGLSEPDPVTAAPTGMDIHVNPASVRAGRDQLLATAKEFGFDSGKISQWYDVATSSHSSEVRSPWLQGQAGYLSVEVQAIYNRGADAHDAGRTELHYTLDWHATATSTPATSAPS